MTEQTSQTVDYGSPAAVAAALEALAAAAPKTFVSDASADPALMAAAARHRGTDALWFEPLVDRLREAGITAGDAKRFGAIVKDVLARQRKQERERQGSPFRVVGPDETAPFVADELPGAPVTADAVVPSGYQLSTTKGIVGLSERDGEAVQAAVAWQPVVIAGILQDTGTEARKVRLAWRDVGGWRMVTAGRGAVMNRAELVKLAEYGLPVSSDNAAALVRYLSAYEAVNAPILPRMAVSGHLGWQDGDEPIFLWGSTMLSGAGAAAAGIDPEAVAPGDWREDWVGFNPSGAGDRQAADGFRAAGTLEGWQAAIAPVADFPRVRFALYASLATPLLHVINGSSFWVDISSPTSRGKTTTAQVAASVWGCPETDTPASVIANWNSTKVYIERRASLCNGLPLILDETKQANAKNVAEIVYMVANGQGRGRGQKDAGVRASSSWRTIGISTGEQPLTAYSQDGGTRARTLTLWGDPWGPPSERTAVTVSTLKNLLPRHYGHAGPRFVAWLLEHRERWPEWQAAYEAEVTEYITHHNGHPVVSRIARYAAAISLAAVLAHEAGILPWDFADPVTPVWEALIAEAGEADRATEALRLLHAWATSQQEYFEGKFRRDRDHNEQQPAGGAIGRWQPHDDYIGFLPHKLHAFLEEQGFDRAGIIRTWADAGWLVLDTTSGRGVRTQTVFPIDGHSTRGYKIPHRVFAEVLELEPGSGNA